MALTRITFVLGNENRFDPNQLAQTKPHPVSLMSPVIPAPVRAWSRVLAQGLLVLALEVTSANLNSELDHWTLGQGMNLIRLYAYRPCG